MNEPDRKPANGESPKDTTSESAAKAPESKPDPGKKKTEHFEVDDEAKSG